MAKGRLLSSSQSKQNGLDLTSPGKRNESGEMKIVKSKMLDSAVSYFMYENALSFHVADLQSMLRPLTCTQQLEGGAARATAHFSGRMHTLPHSR